MKNKIPLFAIFGAVFSILYSCSNILPAQNLGAYTDYRGYFYIFENGNRIQWETMPIKQNKVGGNSVMYVDNADNLKAYFHGEKIDLADYAPAFFTNTDNYGAFYNNRMLYVLDNGKVTRMPGWTGNYAIGDSIIGCYDDNATQYNVYCNGEIKPLPDVVDTSIRNSTIAGDNLLVYRSTDGKLKTYYHNQVYDLGTDHPGTYAAGTSTVAFMDLYSMSFKVFYDGQVATLETQAPKSFKVGDGIIAYVDALNNFKIFYKGNLMTVFTYAPDYYNVKDNVVPFGVDNVGFNVFYKGQLFKLESSTPTSYQFDFNTVAYLDSYGYLKVFSDGVTNNASEIIISKFKLTKNVVMYKTEMNEFNIFLNGQQY